MKKKRFAVCIIALVFLVLQPLSVSAEGVTNSRYFSATGHNVQGDFLKFFDAHGGLDVFGYPRTEQFVENGRVVQYFQRQRMELWPENSQPYNVQLMLIGSSVSGPGDPPISADAVPSPDDTNRRYYAETGHTIAGDFKDFFDSHGGLDIFGYPVAEPKKQGGFLIQNFQRAQFQEADSGPVMLTLLGDQYIFQMGKVPASVTAAVASSDGGANPTLANVSGPLVSSSGKIIFQKSNGGPIYSINPDGSGQTQIGTGMDPSLSPDGQKLAYMSWDYPEGIHVLNLSTGQDSLLFSVHQARAPMWSPDGSKVAFYVKSSGFRKAGRNKWVPDDFFNVAILDLASGKTSNPPNQPGHSFSPSWSPDGSQLVFKGDVGLYIFAKGSTNQIPNTDERFAYPVWSPDGQTIAFMYRQHDHWEVGLINVDGSNMRLLTSSLPFTTPANNLAPSWSSDGSKLAFVSDRDGAWKIYTMNADGSNQVKLTDETIDYQWGWDRVINWGKS